MTDTLGDAALPSTLLPWDTLTHSHSYESHHVASGVSGLNRENNQST